MQRERNYQSSNAPWYLTGVLCAIILLGVGLLHFRPDLLLNAQSARKESAPASRPLPTLDATALEIARQRAAQTDAEQQALRNAIPTEDTSKPPLEPTTAANVAVNQGGVPTTMPSTSFSPTDLGNRPAPTPTTMLTQEQFDASQASEEQNQLNTQLSGLTPAQQMVQVHNAEQNAQP